MAKMMAFHVDAKGFYVHSSKNMFVFIFFEDVSLHGRGTHGLIIGYATSCHFIPFHLPDSGGSWWLQSTTEPINITIDSIASIT